ncbi:MAG TPA: DUF2905 domain-containing protein [bacterium]|nr:DUF2905 domain-containing protein [bacterium]
MQRVLIPAGLALLVAGLCWPVLSRLPLGRLPGDISISRPGVKIFFPLTTLILVSLLLSLLFRFFRK